MSDYIYSQFTELERAYKAGLEAASSMMKNRDMRVIAKDLGLTVIYQEKDCLEHWIDIPRIRYNLIPSKDWKRIVCRVYEDAPITLKE